MCSYLLTCIDERVGSDARFLRHYLILVRAHRVIVFDIEIVFTTVLFELLNEELFVKDLLERADYWMVALTLSFVLSLIS